MLRRVLDGALALTGADFGNIQLLDPVTGALRIVTAGITPAVLWRMVDARAVGLLRGSQRPASTHQVREPGPGIGKAGLQTCFPAHEHPISQAIRIPAQEVTEVTCHLA